MALRTTPPQSLKDNHSHVVQVAVGKSHALLLTDEGAVYSWGGRNDHGQLGRATGTDASRHEPAPIVERLKAEIVIQIACGAEHCLALSQRGALFAWGYNKAGQLGIGLKANPKPNELKVQVPTPVAFPDPQMVVKSCSCGPESSSCVAMKGDVYVWGAISYYLFGSGARYGKDENCTKPVRLRGIPEICKGDADQPQCPDQVAICREQIACTVAPQKLETSFVSLISSMKGRSSQLLAVNRGSKASGRSAAARSAGTDAFQTEDVDNLRLEFEEQKGELETKVKALEQARTACLMELSRIGRELTVCDQQEMALAENATALEVKRSQLDSNNDHASRALDTQLNDINHFKSSNKATKQQLLAQRDEKERENLVLTQEYTDAKQRMKHVEARANLIRALQRGELTSKSGSSADDGLKIADSKRRELAATAPSVLAGVGKFTGVREVLTISDRALQDVSSGMREVSAAASGGDGAVLEEVLEANLRLRKEINSHIQAKLDQAEGRTGRQAEANTGIHKFFEEAKAPEKFGGLQPKQGALLNAAGRGADGGAGLFRGGWGGWRAGQANP